MTQELVPLRDLIEVQIQSLITRIDAQAEKVTVALVAADKAVAKAEIATEKRFDAVNEFRQALADLTALMATRRELEALDVAHKIQLEALGSLITALTRRLDTADGQRKGISSSFGAMVAAISVVVIVVNVILYAISQR